MRKLILLLAAVALSSPAYASVIKTVAAGATDVSVTVKVIDSTDGTPETSVTFETSGIDLEYWIHGANTVTDITEATQTVNGAHSDGGFVAVGHGIYRLDLPDAAVASAGAVEVLGTITGMIVIGGTVVISADTPQTGDSYARLGAPAGASVSADIAALPTDADVNAQADAAIETYHLDHLFAATYDPASKPGTADALLNEMIESDGGVSRYTANALEQGPSGGGALTDDDLGYWTTTVDTVNSQTELVLAGGSADNGAYDGWGVILQDQSTSAQRSLRYASCTTSYVGSSLTLTLSAAADFTVATGDTVILAPALACSDGSELAAIPWNADWDAEVQSEATDALNAYDPPTNTEMDSQFGDIDTLIGSPAGASVSADIAIIDGNVDDIETDTAEIGTAGAGLTNINLPNQTMDITGSLSGSVGSVTGAVGSVTGNVGGNVTGSVGTIAEVVSEPAGVPEWDTATLTEAVAYLMAWYRNEVQQTATTKTLRNDADTAAIVTCAVSDNGTTAEVSECAAP